MNFLFKNLSLLRFLYFLLFLIFYSNSLQGSQELQKVSLRLNWKFQFEFAGFIMAKEKGFYKEAGLDVELKEYEFGLNIQEEVLSGKSTYGIYSSAILLSYLQGKPIKLLASFFKRSAMVLVTKPNIKEPKDLIGKKVMADTKEDFDLKFKYMFNAQGVDTKDLVFVKHTYKIDDFAQGKVDALASYISDQPYKLDKLGIKYNILDPSDYGMYNLTMELFTSKNEANKHPQRTKAFRDASIKGWEYALSHKEETIKIIQKKYASRFSKDILRNEAKHIEKLILPYAYKVGSINKDFLEKQKEIFQKDYNIKGNKSLEDFVFDIKKHNALTKEEKEYLKNKKVIKVCTNPNWKPIEFTEKNKPQGISIDTLKIIANKLDIKLEFVKTKTWSESQKFLKERKCDILPAAIKTKKREAYANFTRAYLKYTLAIITKNDKPFVRSLDNIIDKTMSRKKGSGLITKLRSMYPNIKIVETKGYKEALEMVEDDKVYFTIATLPVLEYYKNRFNLDSLQIAGYTKMKYNLRIAVRNDDDLLLSCLDKTLAIIPKETHNIIYDKWTQYEIIKKIDYKLLAQIAVVIIIVILIFVYKNIRIKKYAKELEKQKELYELVFENSSNGILMMDIKTNRFIKCNNKIVEILGFSSKDDILNTHPSELSPKYQPDGKESAQKANEMIRIAKEKGSHTFEWKHLRPNGEEFWTEIILTPIVIDGEEVIHVSWKDIDERKRTRQKLEELNKTLEIRIQKAIAETKQKEKLLQQQSRLAQMGEMISMIAHQWRQPLTAINSSIISIQTKIMLKKFDLENKEDRERFLEFINQNYKNVIEYVKTLSETIDDFRNFFKPNKQKEKVRLCTPIKRALKIVEASLLNKNIEVISKCEVNDEIQMYANEVMQVVLNILKNSEDNFSEKKTKNPKIDINAYKEDDTYIIKICDNGGGIKEDIASKVFDPYFSTKSEKDGTGLGLYMSKIMIEKHHSGELKLQNIDNGVCFIIKLK